MGIQWIIVSGVVVLLIVALFIFISKRYAKVKKQEFYKDGRLKRDYYLRHNKRYGEELVYYPTGELNKKRRWKADLLQGDFVIYFKNGKTYIAGSYRDGQYVGDYIVYDMDGKVIQTINY